MLASNALSGGGGGGLASYITQSNSKGTGSFGVAVNAGDTVIGVVADRSSTTNVGLSGFSNQLLDDDSFGGRAKVYATTASTTGTFTSTISGGSTTMGLLIVFRDSTLNPASVSLTSAVTSSSQSYITFSPLSGFVSGDIALAIGAVDNGAYVSSTPLLSSLGFTGIASARVGTADGDLIASYLDVTSSGSIPATSTNDSVLNTSDNSIGIIIRIPA